MAVATDYLPEAAYDLGDLCHDFRVSRSDAIVAAVILPIGAVGVAIYAFVQALPLLPPGRWPLIACGAVLGLGTAAVLIGLGMHLRRVLAGEHARVLLFEEGVVCFRSNQVTVCRFDEVREIRELYSESHAIFLHTLKFLVQSGQEQMVASTSDVLEDFARLVQLLQWQVTERMLPDAIAAFHAGQTLHFGALELTQMGVSHKGKFLPWGEVSAIETHEYWIKIKRRGAGLPWATVAAKDLVNRLLLSAIAREALSKVNA
jgi:hypothetical protein